MLNAKKESLDEDKVALELSEQEISHNKADLEQLKRHITEILPKLRIREDLVLRLHFGILGESRFSDRSIIEQITEESKVAGDSLSKRGSLESLYNFDMETDEFDKYNPAEQLFLALIGKIPESWVEYIRQGGVNTDNYTAASFSEIGSLLGVTRERVRQIEVKALRQLKNPYNSRKLRGHLD